MIEELSVQFPIKECCVALKVSRITPANQRASGSGAELEPFERARQASAPVVFYARKIGKIDLAGE